MLVQLKFILVQNQNCFFIINCVACISLALVKYSNEGGPGPRYNMKEVPGSILLIMLIVHAYPMPLFSEAGDKETRGMDPPPHQSNLVKAPFRYILHPLQ
jgi:hypothetical protein